MNEIALEERLTRLQKDLSIAGAQTDGKVLELRVELDRLRLEMEALKTYLGKVQPGFGEDFPQVLAQTIQEVNPEFH